MSFGRLLGTTIRTMDRQLGLLAWLKGEPCPPRGGFDLDGEKLLDWAWICVNLPPAPKRALDIGCGQSPVVPSMLALGYDVVGVDLFDDGLSRTLPFSFIQGDIVELSLDSPFDVIVACSTVEHIGLSGRYGSKEDEEGDLKTMRKIATLLRPGGWLFLTIPMGRDAVYKPWHRVYGKKRLGLLLEGFEVVKSRYFVKEPWGPWQPATREQALEFPATVQRYALGEMVMKLKQ